MHVYDLSKAVTCKSNLKRHQTCGADSLASFIKLIISLITTFSWGVHVIMKYTNIL